MRRIFHSRGKRRFLRIAVCFLLLGSLLTMLGLRAKAAPLALPIFESIAESRVQKLVRETAEELSASGAYGQFCVLRYAADGSVQGLEVNSGEVRRFAADLSAALERELSGMRLSCKIRSGDLLLPRLFSGKGFYLTVTGSLYGGASADTVSTLKEGGLNQTLHRLELEVTVPLTLTVLGREEQITVTSRILIGEAVIVGAIPGGVVVGG
ncbi:MAG: sporulation protein YunB [Clostridia bacterium]|nr:sporulation protein YunB [Clostridia bacterium]